MQSTDRRATIVVKKKHRMTDATSRSKDCEASFTWHGNSTFVFEADARLDPELFHLATQAWKFLDDVLNGLRLDEQAEDWAAKMLTIYYAARIHGASAAATMALAHRSGREAIILSRCQYEYFVKMLYYDHYHDEAAEVMRLLPSYTYRFAESVGLNVRFGLTDDVIDELEELSKAAYRGNFRGIVDSLRADPLFAQSAEDGNPFAVGFLQNATSMFATHWTYGSSVLHAAVQDMPYVLLPRPDHHWDVNVDSRMKAPNKTVLDLNQRCFSATGLLRWRFQLGFEAPHIEWATRTAAVAKRHAGESMDIKSMHD
jgi:hypothetical protein